jgi:V/A-type H+-transporting ATPase subunit A
MKVVGEEGTSIDDYILYRKSEFLDTVYLQQDSFDPVDASVSVERQQYIFRLMFEIISARLDLASKEEARQFFNGLSQLFRDWNGAEWQADDFKKLEQSIRKQLADKKIGVEDNAGDIIKSLEG